MPYHELPGVRLFYELHAEMQESALLTTFMLIHGWACSSRDWDAVLPDLTALGRVVTVDLRGCGKSRFDGSSFSLPEVTGDVLRLLDHLGVADAVVIGHSAGAEVAATAVAMRPASFRGLVAVDPGYGFAAQDHELIQAVVTRMSDVEPRVVAAEYFARLEGPRTSRELALAHQASATNESAATLRGIFREFAFGPGSLHFRPSTDDFLAHRDTPLLAFYRNDARAAVGTQFISVEGDQVLAYDGAGHWLHQEQPARFAADLASWLSGLKARP